MEIEVFNRYKKKFVMGSETYNKLHNSLTEYMELGYGTEYKKMIRKIIREENKGNA
jgi:hypothetical protein